MDDLERLLDGDNSAPTPKKRSRAHGDVEDGESTPKKAKISEESTAEDDVETEESTNEIDVEEKAEINCAVCMEILFKPVTLHCGHCFCAGCFNNSYGRPGAKFDCLTCRKDIGNDDYAINFILEGLLKQEYPDLYEQRYAEAREEGINVDDIRPLPIAALRSDEGGQNRNGRAPQTYNRVADIVSKFDIVYHTDMAPGQNLTNYTFSVSQEAKPVDFMNVEKFVKLGQFLIIDAQTYTEGPQNLRVRILNTYPFTVVRFNENTSFDSRFYMVMIDPKKQIAMPPSPRTTPPSTRRILFLLKRGDMSYSLMPIQTADGNYTNIDTRRIHIPRTIVLRKITLQTPK